MRLRCEGGGQEEGCRSASSGIMLLLLSPWPRLELACSLLARPFILTCPLSCVPPFVSPDRKYHTQHLAKMNPRLVKCTLDHSIGTCKNNPRADHHTVLACMQAMGVA
jgi:hypothetical protein